MSHVLAADYRVADLVQWRDLIARQGDGMRERGLRHLVFYQSLHDPHRVFTTVGVGGREPVVELLRSGLVMRWFDACGVQDIPPVFAGDVIEKIDLEAGDHGDLPGVVIAVMGAVADPDLLVERVHRDADGFRRAGVRKVWVYRALDDAQEVLLLQELGSRERAEQWLAGASARADASNAWMLSAGFGVYPQPFVGTLVAVVEAD